MLLDTAVVFTVAAHVAYITIVAVITSAPFHCCCRVPVFVSIAAISATVVGVSVATASTAVVLPLNIPWTVEDSQWTHMWAITVVAMGRLEASWWKSTVLLFFWCTLYHVPS